MNDTLTSIEQAKRLIEERRYKYFTLPSLGLTIQYREPDMLQLALNNSLPALLADLVIEAYKIQMKGGSLDDVKKRDADVEITNEILGELRGKSYDIMASLCVSFKILNVPETDLDSGVISWKDIPETDAMAFLLHIINMAQNSATEGGGEVSMNDLKTFPDGKQVSKRTSSRKNRSDVRKVASA